MRSWEHRINQNSFGFGSLSCRLPFKMESRCHLFHNRNDFEEPVISSAFHVDLVNLLDFLFELQARWTPPPFKTPNSRLDI